ncbi:MAG TPA: hypothetical protein VEJ39_10865 [Candidatus Acidoferrales bacterium]|nr:hypothetical protein [Candidatus Acidoferrales bacterium]
MLKISGTARDGKPFTAAARTMMVSRAGAVIVTDRKLYEGDRLHVQRTAKNESRRRGMTRVLGQFGQQGGNLLYGIECLDTSVDLWGVDFPEWKKPEEAVARILLECANCRERELAYLDPIRLQEFEANRGLVRHCKTCNVPRIWTRATPAEADPHSDADSEREIPNSGRSERGGSNARRHNLRLKTHLTACIRQAETDDELAVCEEVVADGLNFRSHRRYEESSQILISVPYADASENIFVPARIVRVEQTSTGFFIHAAEYVQPGVNEPLERVKVSAS